MPTPTFTTPPTAPSRTAPSFFRARMDAFLAWIVTCWGELTTAVGWMADRTAEVATNATNAGNSQASAATSASNAALRAADASTSAAAAAAAAASTGGSFPAQTNTNGKVLASRLGVAQWEPRMVRSVQLVNAPSSENLLTNSSAANCGSWPRGPNTSSVNLDQSQPGPNGLRSAVITNAGAAGGQFVPFTFTVSAKGIHTFSGWWRGFTKPAGWLLYVTYLEAANVAQNIGLAFAHASVIADGKWHQYSVSFDWQSNTFTGGIAYFAVDTGPAALNYADPLLTKDTVPASYTATGVGHLLEPDTAYHVSTVSGLLSLFLPDNAVGIEDGTVIAIKDYGRAVNTNSLTIDNNGSLIDDALQTINFDKNGAAIALQYTNRKGWMLR